MRRPSAASVNGWNDDSDDDAIVMTGPIVVQVCDVTLLCILATLTLRTATAG